MSLSVKSSNENEDSSLSNLFANWSYLSPSSNDANLIDEGVILWNQLRECSCTGTSLFHQWTSASEYRTTQKVKIDWISDLQELYWNASGHWLPKYWNL